MKPPDFPANEIHRVLRLRQLDLLDTGPEDVLGHLARLASRATGMPVAMLSLVDTVRQWTHSAVGVPAGTQTPRELSFCAHAICQRGILEIEDARADERFAASPLVRGTPAFVHYAGAPLVLPGGEAIGTLAVAAPEPGRLAPAQREMLAELAAHAVQVLLLRERERQLSRSRVLADAAHLSELAPAGMFTADEFGAVLHGNAQWVQMLGATDLTELSGLLWKTAIHPEDLEDLTRGWKEALRSRRPFAGAFRTRPGANGETRWIQFRVKPVEAGITPVSFVGTSVDVTERKRLERELQHKNQLLESIIEHLPCGVAVFDRELAHVVSNTEMRTLLGLPDHLFEGRPTFARLARHFTTRGEDAGADAELALAERMATIRAREPHRIERIVRGGKLVEIRGSFMPDGGMILTYTDVTAARRAEGDLRTSRQRLAFALQASELGLWEHDLRNGEVYLSEGWARLLHFPEQDRIVAPAEVMRLFPAHELPRILAERRLLLKGEIPRLSLEHQMHRADGSLVWFLSEARVIERCADGRALKVVGTSKDITERKRADAELRRALAAADQANQAKSDFLATMSHEIRTPLNGVIGLTQLLAGAELPPMESDSVAMIDSCAKSLLSLVDNILDLSKIEAGRLALDRVPVDLVQLVQEVSDVFSVRAAEKGIRFDLRHERDVPRWILADPGRLRQVLLNLLGNALKFTAEGGFSLHVFTRGGDAERTLCFEVFDTGIGIAPEDQARLFTRFTQVDASSRRRHSGTGLGLAISRQLAQLMGGDITLASMAGRGSTFTLGIPLQEAAAPAGEKAAASGTVKTGARVLLVEDNEVNQLVAERMLGKLGYANVTTAVTGREAVEACTHADFDIVLMDCQMPVMDGWEATERLRAMGVKVPVLAFTASATSEDRDRCIAAGMSDYLTKPVEIAILADKMRRWLGDAAEVGAGDGAAPDAAPAAFDRGALAKRFLGDAALFSEARTLFLQQTPALLAGLRRAPADLPALRKAMHRIRGSAAMLGADRLADLTLRLELDEDVPGPEFLARLGAIQQAFEDFERDSEEALAAWATS